MTMNWLLIFTVNKNTILVLITGNFSSLKKTVVFLTVDVLVSHVNVSCTERIK